MSFRRKTISFRSKVFITYLLVIGLGLTIPAGSFLKSVLLRTVHADTTPQTIPFSQNWANTGLITADDNWAGVPGIIGYRGDDLTTSTGTDPQTILADGSVTPVDVNANRSDPNTFTTGGITEFDGIANPVVALQGSGTADAPHIVITLNTTGQSNISVGYNLRDIDGSADNAVQAVALQYRVGAAGNYTNIPGAFVADATTGPSLATLVTPVNVNLPADCDNQPVVQVRIITTNAVGSDEWVGVDDISVSTGAVAPSLSINDVSQAETDSGTTTFTFTVSLTAPAGAGGVTFDIATADGTTNPANAGSDYVARSLLTQTILQGDQTYNFDVTVNGDTTPEANETFFVNVTNVTGATVTDGQGLGTINNDDVTLTPIHNIQGSGNVSPLSGSVTTSGIVIGLRTNGFFIQEPDATVDGDPNTSEGIFVFTSSAPPAAAVVGNLVQVTGTISEFIPSADPFSPSQTELTSPATSSLSSGNPLPAPHTITAAETQVNDLNNLEKYEGMRVHVDSLTAISGTQGSLSEANATSTSTGIFYGVITGVARPFREPGIEVPDPVPTPWPSGSAPVNVPRFDFNPERLRVNSNAQPGSTVLDVTSGATITDITGPLDYGFRTYTIDTDPSPVPGVSGVASAVPVPTPISTEMTIASFNMQRFYDTTDDPLTSDVVLTATAFNNRLNKASLAIRNVLQSPDVIGVEEMEGGPSGTENSILQQVANKVNADAGTPGDYQAYLARGNDIGGINVGFLVKSSRISVFSVTQYNKTETYTDPNTGPGTTLNDRPPLVLRASILQTGGTFFFTVIANHLRSLSGIDDLANAHTRVKRQKQAESLAALVHSFETNGDPNRVEPYDNSIVSLGDYNSFEFNDGYVDVVGTVLGTPAPADQVVQPTATISTGMTDLIGFAAANQRYSYSFDGDAQAIDHELVNHNMLVRFSRVAYGRMDADYPEVFRTDANRPERISDHDPSVAYFDLTLPPTAAPATISGRITTPDGSPLGGTVVHLSGARSVTTVTEGSGHYQFDNVDTDNFYTVTPALANYHFAPVSRSFSLIGNMTDAGFTANPDAAQSANAIDMTEYFARQQYLDFLGREPDQGGLEYWSDQINQCGGDAACISQKRIDVSAAFFASAEFQQTGSYIYGVYAGTLGRTLNYGEFNTDRSQVLGGTRLDEAKTAFATSFVDRPEFTSRYPQGMTREQFVDAVIQTMTQRSGVDQSALRNQLLSDYDAGERALVVRHASEASSFVAAEYNKAFVLMEYFGYLRREIDQGGYDYWLDVLNHGAAGNYRGMVCAFLTSTEYQLRFSTIVTHSNAECGQ